MISLIPIDNMPSNLYIGSSDLEYKSVLDNKSLRKTLQSKKMSSMASYNKI